MSIIKILKNAPIVLKWICVTQCSKIEEEKMRVQNALPFKHLHTVVIAILVEDTIVLLRPPVGR